MRELVALYVGRRGFVLADGFRIRVIVTDVKQAYGHIKVMVNNYCSCHGDTGQSKWVNLDSVKLEERS